MNKILQDLKAEKENPDAYAEKKDGRGRKQLIQEFNAEAKLIYEMVERSLGCTQITSILNTRRSDHGKDFISVSTIDKFIQKSPVVKNFRRLREKTGSTDPNSK